VNGLNLSTLLGLAVAKANGATLTRGADGLVVALGARGSFPKADAFTVGNVIIVRAPSPSPQLLAHESRHATQWACCVVLFLPLYLAAAGWSWVRCGDHWSRNTFERRAGLTDGGYVEHPTRSRRRQGDTA
jgi:hypothetical protein